VLSPPAAFVTGLTHATLSDEQVRAVRMGQRVTITADDTDEIAAMDGGGDLVGILVRRGESWKPELVLSMPGESAHG
jgi:hypothetical protein